MGPTPLQSVKKSFGDRKQLVDKLVDLVDKQHGDASSDEVRSRLMGLSNKKLLRLYRTEQTVRERFGDRGKLVAHILKMRQDAGLTADGDFARKLDAYSKARLLDLTKQVFEPRPAKQTADQKLKSKRGRKERERALSKLKSA